MDDDGVGRDGAAPSSAARPGAYVRGELEFDRLAFFSDAIYAISMTLLVVGLEAPKPTDEGDTGDLIDALSDVQSSIIMFFISFIVIGSFWLAHHRFIARLAAIDRTLMGASLPYLAFVAFLPFPSALLGAYTENPVAVGLYALCIAAVATIEAVLFAIARSHRLLAVPATDETFRWGMIASLSPAGVFLLSIPVAFISPLLGIFTWLLGIPSGMLVASRMPAEATEYFKG